MNFDKLNGLKVESTNKTSYNCLCLDTIENPMSLIEDKDLLLISKCISTEKCSTFSKKIT